MLPILKFFGNHKINFNNYDTDELKNYLVSELWKIPIPEKIIEFQRGYLISKYLDKNLARIVSIEKWRPAKFGPALEYYDTINKDILMIGPMALFMHFTSQAIFLPSILYERINWYSPENRNFVNIIRSYYYSIVKHFGGDHVLYADEMLWEKYYEYCDIMNGSALPDFEQSLKARYGEIQNPFFDYKYGKCPWYFVDRFEDIKEAI